MGNTKLPPLKVTVIIHGETEQKGLVNLCFNSVDELNEHLQDKENCAKEVYELTNEIVFVDRK